MDEPTQADPRLAASASRAVIPAAAWPVVLVGLEPPTWWRLRCLSWSMRESLDSNGEPRRCALRLWPIDLMHMHGGLAGTLLTQTAQRMIRASDVAALREVCLELKRRGGSGVPWQLSSRELALYAAGHAGSAAPLEAILSMAPKALLAVDKGRGYSLLHEAAFCRRPANVQALLSTGCDARAVNLIGETALHVACFVVSPDNVEVADLLLAADAGLPCVPDERGQLPIDRLWDAHARWRRVEKGEAGPARKSALVDLLTLLDPTGRSLDTPGRLEMLQELGISKDDIFGRRLATSGSVSRQKRPRQRMA